MKRLVPTRFRLSRCFQLPRFAQNATPGQPFTVLHPGDYRHYVDQFAADEREQPANSRQTNGPGWNQTFRSSTHPTSNSRKCTTSAGMRGRSIWSQRRAATSLPSGSPSPLTPKAFSALFPMPRLFILAKRAGCAIRASLRITRAFGPIPTQRPRKYSFPWAESVRQVTLATGDPKLGTDLLDALIANYKAWEASTSIALSGSSGPIDTRDAMEKSIGGDGYRPTLNSYMVGDARAIADFARTRAEDCNLAADYSAKADHAGTTHRDKTLESQGSFYEVLSPSADSGIRKEKRFKDPGTSAAARRRARAHWLYPLGVLRAHTQPTTSPGSSSSIPHGFAGKYGPTTAERRSPRFRFASERSMHMERPVMALRDHANTARVGQSC